MSEGGVQARAANLPACSSPAFLALPARRPRFALLPRPQAFVDAFEDRALFYDCFWHHDGRRVLLVGPPPVNLDYGAIAFRAAGQPLKARFHTSMSVTVTELAEVAADAREIEVSFNGEDMVLPIQPGHCEQLRGRRVIFTMNKNNDLRWLREWALWHARFHGANAVVITDNGSNLYSPGEVAAVLADVPGIASVAVHNWPHKYGPVDPGVLTNAYWSRFLQIASMSVALRRYGMLAQGMLNCDVDELVATQSGKSIFDIAAASSGGLVVFRGTWVEAQAEKGGPERPTHRSYQYVHDDHRKAQSRQRKWALDPSRQWLQKLHVHPYMHWIEGRPRDAKSMPPDAGYFHFRGINTNWKRALVMTPTSETHQDASLARAFAELPE